MKQVAMSQTFSGTDVEQQDDLYCAQVLGGIPFHFDLCGARHAYDDLVAFLGPNPKVWRKSRICCELPCDTLKVPSVDFSPRIRIEGKVVLELTNLVQAAIDLSFQCGTTIQAYAFHYDPSYPDIYTDPTDFWLEQAGLRDFLAALLANRDKYVLPAGHPLAKPAGQVKPLTQSTMPL